MPSHEASFEPFATLKPHDVLRIDGNPWRVTHIFEGIHLTLQSMIDNTQHTIDYRGVAYMQGGADD